MTSLCYHDVTHQRASSVLLSTCFFSCPLAPRLPGLSWLLCSQLPVLASERSTERWHWYPGMPAPTLHPGAQRFLKMAERQANTRQAGLWYSQSMRGLVISAQNNRFRCKEAKFATFLWKKEHKDKSKRIIHNYTFLTSMFDDASMIILFHWFRQWIVPCLVTGYCLNQCWHSAYWSLKNKPEFKFEWRYLIEHVSWQTLLGLLSRYYLLCSQITATHDDVIKWKHFPRYWPFVRGIHRSPVNSLYKGQWRGALMFS